jgi:hypothetical protein
VEAYAPPLVVEIAETERDPGRVLYRLFAEECENALRAVGHAALATL